MARLKILTLGTFDLPHYGHYRLLKTCSRLGLVTVGLNTDEFIIRYKGRPPILSYDEREKTILEWGYFTYPNGQYDGTISDVLDEIEPNIIAIGTDWARKDYLGQIGVTVDDLESRNISLLYIPYTKGISTTDIKARFK